MIGDNPQKTSHEKIMKAQDPFVSFNKLKIDLDKLLILLEENRIADIKDMINKLVISYTSNSNIIDHIYNEKLFHNNHKQNLSPIKSNDNKIVKINNN